MYVLYDVSQKDKYPLGTRKYTTKEHLPVKLVWYV